jgi:hypothetical protein
MSNIEIVNDSLVLAKELAWELDVRPEMPSEADIYGALAVMNGHLHATQRGGAGVN